MSDLPPCPDAPMCQMCRCAGEDDVCFPGERMANRLMNFGGFQRGERGGFWVNRDDVLRLIEDEIGPIDSAGGIDR